MKSRETAIRVGIVAVLAGLLGGGGVAYFLTQKQNQPANEVPSPHIVKTDDKMEPKKEEEIPFSKENFEPLSIRSQGDRVPIIMYHDIIKQRGRNSVWFDCTKDEFEDQISFLISQNAHPISHETLHIHLVHGTELPPNAVVLTFDDNYQGFYDNAYPTLKKFQFPATMFVHTNFVGVKKDDHPKMDWVTLQKLDKEGLVTIGSHTLSHPVDIRKLNPDEQERELSGSKKILEEKLGHAVPYLAYPDGCQDKTTRDIARRVGYTLAVTVDQGPAEESPDIRALNRYIHTKLKKAWADAANAKINAPAAIYEQEMKQTPVKLVVGKYAGIPLGLVYGGAPSTRRGIVRESVGEFVQQANGVAGINGTFFVDARIVGTSADLIGPSQAPGDMEFQPDLGQDRLPRLANRPVIIWGPKKIAMFPFQPGFMDRPDSFRSLMPDYTDLFLAGAWLVHEGVARTPDQLKAYSAGDFDETRRRAFFGITRNGEIVFGATLDVVSSTKMAEAAVEAGVKEAVLLDSGFSTSLVFNNKIIVTGHTAKDIPSRPVPHAIVMTGTLEEPTDADTLKYYRDAEPATVPGVAIDSDHPQVPAMGSSTTDQTRTSSDPPRPRKRRRRHRSE